MFRWRHYKVLVLFTLVAGLAAARDLIRAPEAMALAEAEASQALLIRFPERPENLYVRALYAVELQQFGQARQLFEQAMSQRWYTNEGFLYNYALLLIRLGESEAEVDRAAELWRKHYPHSKNPDPRGTARGVESAASVSR